MNLDLLIISYKTNFYKILDKSIQFNNDALFYKNKKIPLYSDIIS